MAESGRLRPADAPSWYVGAANSAKPAAAGANHEGADGCWHATRVPWRDTRRRRAPVPRRSPAICAMLAVWRSDVARESGKERYRGLVQL